MKTLRLFYLELRRILRSRLAWLVMALTILSPLAGLTFYKPDVGETMLSIYLGNPALAGGLVGGILFALFAIYEWNRVKRGQMNTLMDVVVSPLTTALIRLFALLCMALLTMGITMLLWLPYTMYSAGAVFDGLTYVLAYLIYMGLALPLAILIAASAYQFTGRFDLSVILFAALAGLSLTVWSDQWQLCWLNPCAGTLSDDFSNFRLFRSVSYMRMTWLLGMAGVWTLSYLAIRRYGKGPIGSMLRSARRIYRPALCVLLLGCCVWTFANQPFIDNSNPDLTAMTFNDIENVKGVTCSQKSVDLRPDTKRGKASGTVTYQLQNTTGQKQVIPFTIRPGCRIVSATANEKAVPFEIGDYQEANRALLKVTIPKDKKLELTLEYNGFLREWNNMGMFQGQKQEISDQYLCLESESLAPILQGVASQQGPFLKNTIDITVPGHLKVIPFSALEAKLLSKNDDGTKTWRILETRQNTALYVGDYVQEDVAAAGLNVKFYYSRKHQSIMEKAEAADALRMVLKYCKEHYGTPNFAAVGSLKLIQSRVSTSGYAAPGASLMNELDFTAKNLNNSEKGTVPNHVMIHEIVHQWWGLGNMFNPEPANDPWSAEGLTVYTTYRIVKQLWGEDYAREHVARWQKEMDDYNLNYYVRSPKYLQVLPKEKQLDITNSLASVQKYSEMPLKILKAEQLVGGEEAMDQILHDLFNRELDPMSPYLTYQDFLDACGLTEEDLNLD